MPGRATARGGAEAAEGEQGRSINDWGVSTCIQCVFREGLYEYSVCVVLLLPRGALLLLLRTHIIRSI